MPSDEELKDKFKNLTPEQLARITSYKFRVKLLYTDKLGSSFSVYKIHETMAKTI